MSAIDLIRSLMESAETKFTSGDNRRDWVLTELTSMDSLGLIDPETTTELRALMDAKLIPQIITVIANASHGMYDINKKNWTTKPGPSQAGVQPRFGWQANFFGH